MAQTLFSAFFSLLAGREAGSTTQKTALALPGHAIAELFILPHLIFDTLATTVEAG